MPYGQYTGVEILDTLEVVAHERYEDLLKKAGILNQAFIDYRTWAATRVNAQGQMVAVTETVESGAIPVLAGESEPAVTEALSDGHVAVVTVAEQRMARPKTPLRR